VFYSGPLDVELRSWTAAGLEKPSVARRLRLAIQAERRYI
jgi:hypothetical protein